MFLDETPRGFLLKFSIPNLRTCDVIVPNFITSRGDAIQLVRMEAFPVDRGGRLLNALQRLPGETCYSVFYVTQRECVASILCSRWREKKGDATEARRR